MSFNAAVVPTRIVAAAVADQCQLVIAQPIYMPIELRNGKSQVLSQQKIIRVQIYPFAF